MEVQNSDKVVLYNKSYIFNRSEVSVTFSIQRRKCYFTLGAARMMDLKLDDLVHPVSINNIWCFFVDNTNKDGYKLSRHGRENLAINSVGFMKEFLRQKNLRGNRNFAFYLNETSMEYKGNKLFEIGLEKQL